MSESSFTIYDARHGATFVVELEDGEFAHALCYVIGIGRDPIIYSELGDIPEPMQGQISDKIYKITQHAV